MPKARIILLLAVLIVAPGCDEVPVAEIKPSPTPLTLVIVTPHSRTIRDVFAGAFSEWHAKEHGQNVNIRWVTRGTPQCLDYVESAVNDDELTLRGLVPDLMFGGGISDHQVLADRSLVRAFDASQQATGDSTALAGVPLTDPQGNWHATALTGFGIFYNLQSLSQRQLPAPEAWADLADPAYFGWVAIADPTRSGSNRFTMDIILQQHGWEKGWGLLLRTVANARTLLPGSSEVIQNVASGMCLVGPCVNFNALREVSLHEDGRLGYVSPTDATVITPDVSSVLRYATFPDLAEKFVRFCMSERGQSLWALRDTGANKNGAPSPQTLFRYSIDPAFYEKYSDRLAVGDNPFHGGAKFQFDMHKEQGHAPIVAALITASCRDNHILLQRAWKSVIDAGMPPEALAELLKPPFDEKTALELSTEIVQDDAKRDALVAEWAVKFRERFQSILNLTRE